MDETAVKSVDLKKNIIIEGARVHNLKNVSLSIPRNKFVVITGLSGSGKSSLAFDTLYAEGQRRYVESLSSYARQFLGRHDKPEVDAIRGISPAIAIEQKVVSRNARSTVGTSTEIYDYLKLLFARVGKTISPVSGKEVKRHHPSDVLDAVMEMEEGTKFYVLSPLQLRMGRSVAEQVNVLGQQGYARLKKKSEIFSLEEAPVASWKSEKDIQIVIDRLAVKKDDNDFNSRLIDSASTAFYEGQGDCIIEIADTGRQFQFSNRFELDGIQFEEPSNNFFSFNNPVGACKKCEGFGSVIGIDPDLVIPDKSLSVYEDAIACWKGEKMGEYKDELVRSAKHFDFPIHRPIHQLSKAEMDLLWNGNKYFDGLNRFFSYLEEKSYKIQYRVMLSRYRGKTICPECKGTRLRQDANYVKVQGFTITDMVLTPIDKLSEIMNNLDLSERDFAIAKRLLIELQNRLNYLCDVGLGYLTLNRLSNSLSGGESQRINLATSLGSSLVGSMYILDEPSIGLHPRDTHRLIKVLRALQKQGNSVIIVEHDEEIMKASDHLIDMGPMAGSHGGEIVFEGPFESIYKSSGSLTADYLNGSLRLDVPAKRRKWKDKISIKGAREHNLKNATVDIPLRTFTVVTGVSGSGKSTLVSDILYPAIKKQLGEFTDKVGECDSVTGDLKSLKSVEYVDQNPIGKSSRSNPVTYVKAFDDIRALFTAQGLSKTRGYKPGHFSFNVPGGRCDNCEGEGEVTIEMQFMADIKLTCDVCKGKRFQEEILEVKYREKDISDILNLTVDDAIEFFSADTKSSDVKKLLKKLEPLQQVGLGYVTLGQSSSTLSGGEAQRIKLASFLGKGGQVQHTLFIFDEPTTGLHFHDVKKLLLAFEALIEKGHSILVIEHDMDVIKCADWVIDMGPDGGELGGEIVFTGTPEDLAKQENNHTARYLKNKLAK